MFQTITALFFRFPFVLQCVPPVWDTVAWKFSIVHSGIQMIFYWVLPHDHALVMSSAGKRLQRLQKLQKLQKLQRLQTTKTSSTAIFGKKTEKWIFRKKTVLGGAHSDYKLQKLQTIMSQNSSKPKMAENSFSDINNL